MFSAGARATLESAGWSEGRKVDLRAMESTLREAGLGLHEDARLFLETMYGINIVLKDPRSGVTWHLCFDPVQAFERFDELVAEAEQRAVFAELAGSELSVVGHGYDLLLLMARGGATYGVDDTRSAWCTIGRSVEDTVNNLCNPAPEFHCDGLDPYGGRIVRR
jgi:hypothetical protein